MLRPFFVRKIKMKITILLLGVLLIFGNLIRCSNKPESPPRLKGPYLGQKPPGMISKLFAPGIVSLPGSRDLMHGFFDQGNLFVLYRYPPGFQGSWTKQPLILIKQVKGNWTAPYESIYVGKPWFYNLESVRPGERVVFSWTRNLDGSGPPGELYLWQSIKTRSGWTKPVRLKPPVNTGFETWPSLTRDQTLYFFSRRSGGYGKFDIYCSFLEKGEYQEVQNLGARINTEFTEEDPYIAPDGSYLLFDSNRPGGLGGYDIYISWRNGDGSWSRPTNLGQKINTEFTENRAYVSPDGKFLFFSSDRSGDYDAWWVDAAILERRQIYNLYQGAKQSWI